MLVVGVAVERILLLLGLAFQSVYFFVDCASEVIDGFVGRGVQLLGYILCVYFMQDLVDEIF
jgi:hypothetical protein